MPLFIEHEVRSRAQKTIETERRRMGNFSRTANVILESMALAAETGKTYDAFLSHSIKDGELILGIKGIMEDLNYSVYVDWLEDRQLDRTKITTVTASTLRKRMNLCRSLLYITTDNAENSRWMPWECGYFDGRKGKVAIVPIKSSSTSTYTGQEYLGLYPYCTRDKANYADKLWINTKEGLHISYDDWIEFKGDVATGAWQRI